MAATNQIQSKQVFMHGSCNQPYRYGGRVGLFGHYLRSLRIILLLTCIKLDAVLPKRRKRCSKEHLLKSICELATNLEGVERRYVKKGQRLLFCGHISHWTRLSQGLMTIEWICTFLGFAQKQK